MTIGTKLLALGALPKGRDPYVAVLAAFVSIVYRFTNVDDLVFSRTDHQKGRYSYIRYAVPDTPLEYEVLCDRLAQLVDETEWFSSREELERHLTETVELSHSQLRDFRNYCFDTGSEGECGAQFEFGLSCTGQDVALVYNAAKYTVERITSLTEQVSQFLAVVADEPRSIVTRVSLLTDSQAPVLPDPTSDLDWAGYPGAIHEIFERNAAQWPDRTCVIETRQQAASRVFTYQQINRASNIIAHYLIGQGICVGDVVTIYSSRSVELLVCVMGILKAGGTFSVIDPAYPPLRQNIYLSVAKPAGLLVIGKAGTLDSVVEQYIKDSLRLKARLPSVALEDNGVVLGGGGPDVLRKYDGKQDEATGVAVGPDSHPTLAFTSGSEGVPKGVLGRHYSLAYYFPWMAQTFGLSDKDNFTMLSGIAHDPVQRDMFTPLFLGAKLLIPTADDIGTPGRLAHWMLQHSITVTHLTPAMGQVLASQAVDKIPTLRNAFFVGDLLTRKDCIRLQALAPNVLIINMYGTTETQRAVSYFRVKSYSEDSRFLFGLKDVIPAGRGMKNVQLLVVNRYDQKQTCGIGEVGELYVRAAGLAEGYRGLAEYTSQKFLTNWFVKPGHWPDLGVEPWRSAGWKGPRDRMYRTGDLGRYLPDGNVEVTGRIDDQIKIRGFRIELGEIDTHVSKFPSVLENRTIVKKDANNENYLLTYLVLSKGNDADQYLTDKSNSIEIQPTNDVRVPIVQSLVKYHHLATALKQFLSTKLASYAVPSIVVVLPKLPLNPNGKVDKNKLPVPTPEELQEASKYLDVGTVTFTPVQQRVKDIWYDILPTKPVINSISDSFFDLGGHSILATRMIFEVRKQFNVDLPLGSIFKHPTIESFSKVIEGTGAVLTRPSDDYSKDAKQLIGSMLPLKYPALSVLGSLSSQINVFITGTTGFLGSFLVKTFLSYKAARFKVFAHVRAVDATAGMARLKKAMQVYDNWDDSFANRIQVVIGDLAKDKFGLDDHTWTQLNDQIDLIVHNGAMVHWVYPYTQLRDANVISTINVFNMSLQGKPKVFEFVSSTSTIDTEHYFELSDKLTAGIPESDDLKGSEAGLGTGYGQSKWAAEHLIRAAGNRGLTGHIIRPGYITGASYNGSSNTDDFLLRLMKGCIEIGALPNDIQNRTNAVPVDHVARIILATSVEALSTKSSGIKVAHVTGHPRIKLNDYLSAVNQYGYNVARVPYSEWKTKLETYVNKNKESALYPLLHMVLGDLGNDTRAPELDDTNTVQALQYEAKFSGSSYKVGAKGQGLDAEQLGIYISYLLKIGFLPKQTSPVALPEINISREALDLAVSGAGGRGSAAK